MADQRVELWDAINDYVRSCYGDPDSHVHGNTSRQDAVVRIEELWNRRAPDPRLINTLKRLHDAVHEDETTSGFECVGTPHYVALVRWDHDYWTDLDGNPRETEPDRIHVFPGVPVSKLKKEERDG